MASTLILVLMCVLHVSWAEEETCYALNQSPYLSFGTKTAYEYAYSKRGVEKVPDCSALQVWLVSRHGTRWIGSDDIPEFNELKEIRNHIISNYNANKGELCTQDVENLKAWEFNMTPDQGDMLTRQGREDLYYLGRRVKTYFPELFNVTPSMDKLVFRHTDTPRTKESAEYFVRGVLGLGKEDPSPVLPDAIPDDRLIYSYHNCPEWDKESDQAKAEQKKFDNSVYMSRTLYNVSRRLGFDYNLTKANVKNMYDGCRYQKAWNVTGISPWCAAFSKEDLEVMEYSEDVKYYYKSGPGKASNMRLACALVKDLYDRFSQVEAQPEAARPLGLFYFTHQTMIDMLSARLGLNEQSLPPTADNFPEQRNRAFRTSHIVPFTGNVLAVLYKCTRGEPLQTIFYQAEDIVRYPGCSVGLCEWNYIKQRFSSFTQDPACTNDQLCFKKSGAHALTSSTLGVLAAALTSLVYLRTH